MLSSTDGRGGGATFCGAAFADLAAGAFAGALTGAAFGAGAFVTFCADPLLAAAAFAADLATTLGADLAEARCGCFFGGPLAAVDFAFAGGPLRAGVRVVAPRAEVALFAAVLRAAARVGARAGARFPGADFPADFLAADRPDDFLAAERFDPADFFAVAFFAVLAGDFFVVPRVDVLRAPADFFPAVAPLPGVFLAGELFFAAAFLVVDFAADLAAFFAAGRVRVVVARGPAPRAAAVRFDAEVSRLTGRSAVWLTADDVVPPGSRPAEPVIATEDSSSD